MTVDVNSGMAGHARAAIAMVREAYGHELDFTEPTIGAVESLLDGFGTEGDESGELYTQIAVLFGSSLGEMIRAHYHPSLRHHPTVSGWPGRGRRASLDFFHVLL